ncbi:hypothetical protein T4D_17078 [Trichinella pseudospiralis]|uniref:Uncharacterized protein n=1 Tax=Trichinella pseudospiralis TaxID=6337 RepID=A0A0V1F5I5_TRIPS|nr:hypothetical protein T4D_17078 [Trichinella pseudospiralis]
MYKYIRLKISKMPYIRFSPMRSTFYHLETVVCKTEISAVFAAFYHHEVYLGAFYPQQAMIIILMIICMRMTLTS